MGNRDLAAFDMDKEHSAPIVGEEGSCGTLPASEHPISVPKMQGWGVLPHQTEFDGRRL